MDEGNASDNNDKTETIVNEAETNLKDFDKIEVINDDVKDDNITEYQDKNAEAFNTADTGKTAGQLAKEFFRVLQETINFRYAKTDCSNNKFNDNECNDKCGLLFDSTNIEDEGDTSDVEKEKNQDIPFSLLGSDYKSGDCSNTNNSNTYENKLSAVLEFFFGMVRTPKIDGLERRRKSSCFWPEQSPSEFDSREETVDDFSPEDTKLKKADDKKKETAGESDKLETYSEFLSSAVEPTHHKSDIVKSPDVKIQRKIFKKRSSEGDDKQSLLEFIFDPRNERKRQDSVKSASSNKLIKVKQKSLEETSSNTFEKRMDDFDVASISGTEKRESLVEFLFSREKSANFTSLLRRLSQDSTEILFIDDSPVTKNRESLVDLLLKCMDTFEATNHENGAAKKEIMPKKDAGSKNNMLLDSRVAIAKPENFELSPEIDSVSEYLHETVIDVKPSFKDMGTSCDISDSTAQDELLSLDSRMSPSDDVTIKEEAKTLNDQEDGEELDRDGRWISPEQLAELRRCAEIIFKEVNSSLDSGKLAGTGVDACECKSKMKAAPSSEIYGANYSLESKDTQSNIGEIFELQSTSCKNISSEISAEDSNKSHFKDADTITDVCITDISTSHFKSCKYYMNAESHNICIAESLPSTSTADECRCFLSISEHKKMVSVALETSFDYIPSVVDESFRDMMLQVDMPNVYYYRGELEMINESMEIDEVDSV